MEEASWRRHHGGGITEEGITEEETSWRRHRGGGIVEEASWRRHHRGGRHHGGCIQNASGRHLGGIWEASGKHLDASGKHLGGSWRHQGGVWGLSADLGCLGGSRLRNAHHSQSVCFFSQKVLKRHGVLKAGVTKYCVWQQIW
jgi:hypothetical protein